MLTTKRLVALASVLSLVALVQVGPARATTRSDQPAAIVIYPKIAVDTTRGTDTIIQLTNGNVGAATQAHCFYVNASSHCTNEPLVSCRSSADCGGLGACLPGWSELDFSVVLTPDQPLYWVAGVGRNNACAGAGTCDPLPLQGTGVCSLAGFISCTSDVDCMQYQAGKCLGASMSNAGTAVPPAPDDPFVGELKCVEINGDGTPSSGNDLMGRATIVTDFGGNSADAQAYNAVGVRAISPNADNVLVLGGDASVREYESCPSTLILDHLFDGAPDPIDGSPVVTDLTLVPCSEDFALGASNIASSTAQFLVFNEFEQRFSANLPVNCFAETLLSNIDTTNNARSVFSVNVSGTIAGQVRIRPVGAGLVGVARVMKVGSFPPSHPVPAVVGFGAAYNLQQQGERNDTGQQDTLILP